MKEFAAIFCLISFVVAWFVIADTLIAWVVVEPIAGGEHPWWLWTAQHPAMAIVGVAMNVAALTAFLMWLVHEC